MTDADVKAALTDRDVLTLSMLGEARGEEIEGRLAVANVILARVADDRWPDDIKGVCWQPYQFSCWNRNDQNYPKLMAMARHLVADHAIRSTFVRDAVYRETEWLADGVLAGVARNRVGGSNHYMTRALWETAPPSWAKGQSPTCFISRHVFFKL